MSFSKTSTIDRQWRFLKKDTVGTQVAKALKKLWVFPPSRIEQASLVQAMSSGIQVEVVALVPEGFENELHYRKLRERNEAILKVFGEAGVKVNLLMIDRVHESPRWEHALSVADGMVEKMRRAKMEDALKQLLMKYFNRNINGVGFAECFGEYIAKYIALGSYFAGGNRVIVLHDEHVLAQFVRRGAGATPVLYFRPERIVALPVVISSAYCATPRDF